MIYGGTIGLFTMVRSATAATDNAHGLHHKKGAAHANRNEEDCADYHDDDELHRRTAAVLCRICRFFSHIYSRTWIEGYLEGKEQDICQRKVTLKTPRNQRDSQSIQNYDGVLTGFEGLVGANSVAVVRT